MPSILLSNNSNSVQVDEIPDQCPWCHRRCIVTRIDARYIPLKRKNIEILLQATFQCPNNSCGRLFFAEYALSKHLQYELNLDNNVHVLIDVCPNTIDYEGAQFPESIKKLTERFCRIYTQALSAQAADLDEIAGPGYRKAFEVLIRDYLISLEPDKKDIILEMTLGSLIANKVTDANLKLCAERATWLGNDQVHYTRIFTDHDVEDLKELIQLAVNWIDSSLRTKHFQNNLNKAAKEQKPTKTK